MTASINVNGLFDPTLGNSGLAGGDFVLVLRHQRLRGGGGQRHPSRRPGQQRHLELRDFGPDTATPGYLYIPLTNNGAGIITGTPDGALVVIDFRIKSNAPYGVSLIDLAADAQGVPPATALSDQNFAAYVLGPTPQNGHDGGDGLVTVINTNQAPVANNDFYGITLRQSTSDPGSTFVNPGGVLANDTDADLRSHDGGAGGSGPSHGVLNFFNADGSFSYTPDLGYIGPDSFTYKANDGFVDSNWPPSTSTSARSEHPHQSDRRAGRDRGGAGQHQQPQPMSAREASTPPPWPSTTIRRCSRCRPVGPATTSIPAR